MKKHGLEYTPAELKDGQRVIVHIGTKTQLHGTVTALRPCDSSGDGPFMRVVFDRVNKSRYVVNEGYYVDLADPDVLVEIVPPTFREMWDAIPVGSFFESVKPDTQESDGCSRIKINKDHYVLITPNGTDASVHPTNVLSNRPLRAVKP